MGIQKFASTFVKPLPECTDIAQCEVEAVFIDANQFIYSVIEMLKNRATKSPDSNTLGYDIYVMDNLVDEPSFWRLTEELSRIVVTKELVEPLKLYHRVKQITLCLDGTPCAGKLLQQWQRRKNPSYYAVQVPQEGLPETGQAYHIVLSDAMILAGSRMLQIFGSTIISLFKEAFKGVAMEFSMDNTPGEGEHKMLDFFRHTIGTAQGGSAGEPAGSSAMETRFARCMLWSNDSDVPVCLLSSRVSNSVFIKTTTVGFGEGGTRLLSDKVYRVNDIVARFCADTKDVDNCQLIISFFGNDFLPQMLNTVLLPKCYEEFRKATIIPPNGAPNGASDGKPNSAPCGVSRKISLVDNEGNVSIPGLIAYLRNFDDFAFYMEPYQSYISKRDNSIHRMYQFEAFPRGASAGTSHLSTNVQQDALIRKVEFKRFYYAQVFTQERFLPSGTSVCDAELDEFEHEMALNYLQVYIWYHYYANGLYMVVGDSSGDTTLSYEPFYRFNYPPLFDSLLGVLMDPTRRSKHGESLNDLMAMKVRRRQLSYWGTLPRYAGSNLIPHALSVLQKRDAVSIVQALNLPNEVLTTAIHVRHPLEEAFRHQPTKNLFVKTRLTERIDLPQQVKPKVEQQAGSPVSSPNGSSSGSPSGEVKPQPAFRLENGGTKVYMKPDIPKLMSNIAKALDMVPTCEPVETMKVGTIHRAELAETRNRMFALDGEADM